MNINRKNYEVFFIDYFDGKLTAEQVAELVLFISQNPDLAEEFHSFEEVTLPISNIEFQDKISLKNISKLSFIISGDTFDTNCIAYIEGDLDQSEKSTFEKYLTRNPEKYKEYKIFTKSILKPEPEIVFENKASLKRFEIKRIYKRILIASISAAASVIIIFFLYFLSANNTEVQSKYAVKNTLSTKNIAETLDKSDKKIIPIKIKDKNKLRLPAYRQGRLLPMNRNRNDEEFNIANKNNSIIAVNKIKTNNDTVLHENNQEIIIDKIEHLENKKLITLYVESPIHNNITIDYSNYKNPKKKTEHQTLAQIFKTKIQKAIKGNNTDENHKFGFIDVADALVRGVNKITGKKMKLQKTYDSKGDIETIAFYSENLQVYKGGKK